VRFAAGSSVGLAFAATFDSDWCEDDTRDSLGDCHVSALPIVKAPSVRSKEWDEACAAVDAYLALRSVSEQTALNRFMAAVEHDLQAPRSRTTTLDAPWLAIPGADSVIAAEWMARLNGGAQ
jgi:hypothetical protein